MLVKFAIDPSILTGVLPATDAVKRLRRAWLGKGLCVLVDPHWHDGSKDRSSLNEAISYIEGDYSVTKIKDDLEQMIVNGKSRNLLKNMAARNPEPPEYDCNFVGRLSPHIDILVSGEGHRQRFASNLAPDIDERTVLSFPTPGTKSVEVVTLDEFDLAHRVTEAEAIRSGSVVDQDSDLDEVWEKNFKDEFCVSKTIHIVDRYILRPSQLGLEMFIKLAKKHTPEGINPKVLTIYADVEKDPDRPDLDTDYKLASEAFARVASYLKTVGAEPHPFREVEIRIIKRKTFSKTIPARFIRFDDIVVVSPDHGAEVFQPTRVNLISYFTDIKRFRTIELELFNGVQFRRTI